MALVTRLASASMDTVTGKKAAQLSGDFYAGEALDLVAPCYIKTSDGKIYMSNGTAADEAAEVVGFTARATALGQPVTLFGPGTRFRYAAFSGQAGDLLYVAATAGRLDTAATTGDAVGVARVVNATDIRVIRGL
jgi:hypothetical protein